MRHLNLLLPFFFLTNCSSEKPLENPPPQVVSVDSLTVFLDFENHGIVQPADIEILENGNLIAIDSKTKKVTIVNPDGSLINQFGSEGKGPAEFVTPAQILLSDDLINIVDFSQNKILEFDEEGNFKDSFIYKSQGPMDNIALAKRKRYYAQAGGIENYLLSFTDASADTSFMFGEAKGTEVEVVDFEQSRNDIQNGRVPAFLKNMVSLTSSNKHLYAFLDSYSELRKYDFNGNLVWSKAISLPDNELLLEQVIEASKRTTNGLPFLRYSYDIKAIGEEIYILGSKVYEKPQHLTVINDDGEILRTYEFSDPEFTFGSLAVNIKTNTLYLSSGSDGIVYRVKLS